LGEVVGEQLRRHAAPGKAKSRRDHRQRGRGTAHAVDDVGRDCQEAEPDEHERDGQVVGVGTRARGRAQRRAGHAEHDRAHRNVLAPAGVLAQHALAEEQQHEQAHGHRRLDHDERCQQQRHHLQWPTEQRQSRAGQPARSPEQAERKRRVQVLGMGGALGVHRLQRDP